MFPLQSYRRLTVGGCGMRGLPAPLRLVRDLFRPFKPIPMNEKISARPLFHPEKAVVCTGFAIHVASPSNIRGDVRKIFALRYMWTVQGGATPSIHFRRWHR